ncbi:MAG: biotin--[acetyl-CoA-carboxylase] ligase [Roseobacter sp.]
MTAWPDGYGRIVLAEVGSTLDEAVRAAADHPAPFWLLAHSQTAARGRRGRPWAMPPGNFAATLVLQPSANPSQAALRSFVMSLALYRSFVEVTGRETAFALKWPNDVLLNGGKVAGILLESAGQAGRVDMLTIGIGVNLARAPNKDDVEEGAVRPVSVVGETSVHITPEAFLDVLAAQFATLEQQFQDHGFDPIRRGWMAHAARLGEVITARTARDTLIGTFEDVDAHGHLVLRGAHGVTRIAAADVYF